MAKEIILLSGDIQSGKTTFLSNWIQQKELIAGILTPVKDEERFFYFIDEKKWAKMQSLNLSDSCFVGKFQFSKSNFNLAAQYLRQKLTEEKWNYVVVDEIGPLELNKQLGFWSVFNQILQGNYNTTVIIVVRKKMLEDVETILKTKQLSYKVIDKKELKLL